MRNVPVKTKAFWAKTNPLKLPERALRESKAAKGKQLPAWYKAMKLHPPAPKPLFGVIPEITGQFKAQTIQTQSSNVSNKSKKTFYMYKAPTIIYDEDVIRDWFYKKHPFELDRARNIVEQDLPLGFEWTKITGNDEIQVPLSGESVVQRTLYVFGKQKQNGKSDLENMNVAYQNALYEFYQERVAQEAAEREHRKEVEARYDAFAKQFKSIKEKLEQSPNNEEIAAELESLFRENSEFLIDGELVNRFYAGKPYTKRFYEYELLKLKESKEDRDKFDILQS